MAPDDVVIFTLIRDGNLLFKLWYRWYRQFIKNIIVLDLNSQDGSAAGLDCEIRKFSSEDVDKLEAERTAGSYNQLVNETKSALLQKYRCVIYTDYDELLFHPSGLDTILAKPMLNRPYYHARGFDIVQNRKYEKQLDCTQPLFSQRKYWFRNTNFDKPLITSLDFHWAAGYHSAFLIKQVKPGQTVNKLIRPNYCPGLFLLHLHQIDYQHNLSLNQRNVDLGRAMPRGGDYNLFTGEDFERWWKTKESKLKEIYPDVLQQLCSF